jgi:hypothetical protein
VETLGLLNPGINAGFTGCQFNLEDFAAHFHNPLLFPEPAIKGNQLGKKSILQLALSSNPGLAGNTGRHLKHPHNLGFSSMDDYSYTKITKSGRQERIPLRETGSNNHLKMASENSLTSEHWPLTAQTFKTKTQLGYSLKH